MPINEASQEVIVEGELPKYYTYEDYPIEDLMVYGGIDCLVTSDLLAELHKKITDATPYWWFSKGKKGEFVKQRINLMSIRDSYLKYTNEAHDFILDLEINGIKYDVELNKVFKAQLESEITELETLIWNNIPSTRFNLDSGAQLNEFMYQTLGLKTERKTKSGELSTDGDTLKELAKTYPEHKAWLTALAKHGDLSSIYNTFVKDYIEEFVKRDGRVHASYSLHGTGSFRTANDRPNLAQLPRPKHGYNLRRLFTVDVGKVFIALDFSSAEVKILGALCRDPALLEAIRKGQDFHALSASSMYSIPYDDFVAVLGDENHELYRDYKLKRQYSKALTFGILKLLRL